MVPLVFLNIVPGGMRKEKGEEGGTRVGRLEGEDFWMAGKPLAFPLGSPLPRPCGDFPQVPSLFRYGM